MATWFVSDARRKRRLAVKQATLTMAKRPCDGCTACCTAMGVAELSKAPNEPCTKALPNGCGIYEGRPKSCREFHCLWRFGLLDLEHRPDKSGVVFDITDPNEFGRMFVARPAWPGALDDASHLFDRLAKEGHLVILVFPDGRRRIVGPEERVREIAQSGIQLTEHPSGRRK